MSRLSPEVKDLIAEFEWTRDRHGGDVVKAAPIFGITPAALEQTLRRAIAKGASVKFKGVVTH